MALVAACLVALGPGSASATSCRFSDGVARARVDGGTALRLFVWPESGRIWWGNQSDSSQDGYCGRATVRNTDRIIVTGKGRTGRLDYQMPYLPFGDVEVVMRGGMTAFWMTGLGGSEPGEAEEVRLGERGVDVTGDGEADVLFHTKVRQVYLFLLGGDDRADARGGAGTGDPWPRKYALSITGGDGTDVIHGHAGRDLLGGDAGADELHGHGGPDELTDADADHLYGGGGADVLTSLGGSSWLYGGAGEDVLDAADLIVDAVLDGGGGDDRGWWDDDDPAPVSVEERLVR